MAFVCNFCGGGTARSRITAREMMLGLRDAFDYDECSTCGALQIAEIPADLSRYYPPSYYSYASAHSPRWSVLRWLKRRRFRAALERNDEIGRLLVMLRGSPEFARRFRRAGIRLSAAVLDVGCGGGALLVKMHDAGFRDLTGIDPFLEGDRAVAPNARILKRELREMTRCFDLIIFNHSLEHAFRPTEELIAARDRLTARGAVFVALPIAGGWAWREYGADWVQLDAPRHVSIPTVASMHRAAARAGLAIECIEFQSAGVQFWGSELYRRDIPLTDARSPWVNPASLVFSAKEMKQFRTRAAELNRAGDGDEAWFLLRPAASSHTALPGRTD